MDSAATKGMKELQDRAQWILEAADMCGISASRYLHDSKSELGQFMTPQPIAEMMARMFLPAKDIVRLLDAGAGVGILTAAFITEICHRSLKPKAVTIIAYEVDSQLCVDLQATLDSCAEACRNAGINFSYEIRRNDFIKACCPCLQPSLFESSFAKFDCAILNPPYKKIHASSETRKVLEACGIQTGNLYSAFLAVATGVLKKGGELVAITPRSFCNGPYFKSFRKSFLQTMALDQLHVFESRDKAFQRDEVLQETVIFHALKTPVKREYVMLTSSERPGDPVVMRTVPYHEVVKPNDSDAFIHIVADDMGKAVAERMSWLKTSLADLGLSVSTGRVVDFRAKQYLQMLPHSDTMPLIYPAHFESGYVKWPNLTTKKPNALTTCEDTDRLFVPRDVYVLVKRFSAKEERRRIMAAIYDPGRMKASVVGFENHLNYFYGSNKSLSLIAARGLTLFLNSTIVDVFFRQFNGHTQVNATDLRNLKYPTQAQLESLGKRIGTVFPSQEEIDRLIEEELFSMANGQKSKNPIVAKRKIDEALTILKALGLPREQQNERSALTLLALLDLKPSTAWADSGSPMRGITEMMNFFKEHYGKEYAPNSRETVRRFTVHQFLQAGLVTINPDESSRPTNSPKSVYQIEATALGLLQSYGTANWPQFVLSYLDKRESLQQRYARERDMEKIPVQVRKGMTINLSPGGQNVLVKAIIEEFCPCFAPKGQLIYVGDTGDKWGYFDKEALTALGITVEEHGKMPDVVIHHTAENWLILVEAVTSHGPVNSKRRIELESLFKNSKAGLVYVTAFLTRKDMVKYLKEISWETEVWVAESPSHMIHFNGDRFLGPH